MLALVIATAIQAPDLTKKVTFTSVAKPAKVVLADISKSAGVNLTTSQVLEKEVLVLHVKDVPVATLMKRLASITHGEWQQEAGGYRLIRTATTTQQLARDAHAKRTALIKKSLEEAIAKAKPEPFDSARAKQLAAAIANVHRSNTNPYMFDRSIHDQLQAFEAKTPGGRLYASLLRHVDPAHLASIRPGGRLVFSTSPTRMQLPFTGNTSSALKSFAAEQALWAQAKQAAADARPSGFPIESASENQALESGPKALLIVTLRDETELLNLELLAGDTSGNIVDQHHGSIGVEMFQEPNPAEIKDTDEAELELSADSKQLAVVIRESFGKQAEPNIPRELKLKLAATDKHDPLSFIASDGLIGYAKAKGVNLIGNLPDLSTYTLGLVPAITRITASSIGNALAKAQDLVVRNEDGWLEVKPVDPIGTTQTRIDRIALARFLTAGLENKRWTLDDFAAYALADPGVRTLSPPGRLMVVLTCMELVRGLDPDLIMLRIYGSLSPSQRQGLRSGGKFPFNQLSPQQRSYVQALLFGGDSSFMAKPPQNVDSKWFVKAYGFSREPTEFMPNGVPPDGYFTAEWSQVPVAYAYGAASDVMARPMEAHELAWDLVTKESPDKYPGSQNQPKYSLFKPAYRLKINFTFELTEIYHLIKFLTNDDTPANAKAVPYEELPADLKENVKKLADQYRQMTAMPGGPGKPPPPEPSARSRTQ